MRSSFTGLEVSKRTIQLAQKSLDITVNNQSNIMTPGYTRQRVDTNALYLRTFKNWQTKQARLSLAGQGVQAFGVAQVRNVYLDRRFREMNSQVAEFGTKEPILHEIQTMLDVYENVGMDGKLAIFKRALSEYATDSADNKELANIVQESALHITTMLNSYARDLEKLLNDNIYELSETIKYVNTIFEKISMLNHSIVKEYKATEYNNIAAGTGVSPYGPLELMDSRNLLLDELSGYANIRVQENHDGSINVFVGDAMLVDGIGGGYERLVMRDFADFNAAVIHATNGQELNIRSGEIKARMDMVNGNGPYANSFQNSGYGIPYYREAVDAFAAAFAELMNRSNGVIEFADSSRAMFGSSLDVYDASGTLIERGPITASTIRISEEWRLDPTMIGRLHSVEIEGSTILNLGGLVNTVEYSIEVQIGTTTETVTFTAGANMSQTTDNLNAAIRTAFGLDPDAVVVAEYGLIANFIDGNSVLFSVGEMTDPNDPTEPRRLDPTRLNVTQEILRQVASTNLDGNNAHKLLLALDETVRFGRSRDFEGTPFDYIAFLSNRLGQGINFIEEQYDTALVTVNNLLDSRDAISGVSTDEEGINMLIYQKWYNAAARMMTALDDLLDRIINGMGRVGL